LTGIGNALRILVTHAGDAFYLLCNEIARLRLLAERGRNFPGKALALQRTCVDTLNRLAGIPG
jgi:hypothetical protein